MAAPKGNEFWKLAKTWGKDKSYTPEALWSKAIEYFAWVASSPLKEEKVFATGKRMQAAKLRAMTIRGFCIFANIATSTFQLYEKDKGYSAITARIRDIIYTQKFEGAAAGLLESNIIARELGLADRQEMSVSGQEVCESRLNDLSAEQLAKMEDIANGG